MDKCNVYPEGHPSKTIWQSCPWASQPADTSVQTVKSRSLRKYFQMPQAPQTLVVKDQANNDRTYDLVSPASGYNAVAEYADKVGADVRAAYRRFTILVRDSKGPKASKITQMKATMPFMRSDLLSSAEIVAGRAEINITVTIPTDFPVADIPNFVATSQNLFKTTLVTAVISDGGPAT